MMPVCSTPTSHEITKCECTAVSRSTSAGSHQSGEPYQQSSGRSLSSLLSDLPEYEYPMPFVIRNTFIDTQVVRPLSLDDFFEERRILSCPVAMPDDEGLDDEEDERPTDAQPLRLAITTGAQAFMTTVAAATGFWAAPEYAASAAPMENFNATQPMPHVLMLSEALPELILGSSEMPTVGSGGHFTGTCKPCAFFYTRGCENGVQCPFCHLCPADEKRKRQKEKVSMLRDMRQQQQQQQRRQVSL